MSDTTVAGEEIAGEHEPEQFAIEAHVPVRMPWEMDGAQAVPDIDAVAIVEPAVRSERPKTEHWPANAFQPTGDARPTNVARMPGKVIRIQTRCSDPCPALTGDCRYVQNVIEVPVCDDDTADRLAIPTAISKCPPQKKTPTDKSGVQQIQPRVVAQDIEVEGRSPDLEKIGKHKSGFCSVTIGKFPLAEVSLESPGESESIGG